MKRPDPSDPTLTARRRLDRALCPPMVLLAYAYILLLAAALPQMPEHQVPPWVVGAATGLILLIWPLFLLEALARLIVVESGHLTRLRVLQILLAGLLPPMRIGLSPASAHGWLWLPGLGWSHQDKPLRKYLLRVFSGPMIFFALLIIPVLVLELLWSDQIDHYTWLGMSVDVTLRLIWLAFAIEFFTGLAAHRDKITYVTRNWINATVVVLPLLSFLRVLRVMRVAEMLRGGKLAKMARAYRLRGLAQRVLRALVVLKLIERLSTRGAQRRLNSLHQQVRKKHEEIEELEEEIAELEQILAEAARRKRVEQQHIEEPQTEARTS